LKEYESRPDDSSCSCDRRLSGDESLCFEDSSIHVAFGSWRVVSGSVERDRAHTVDPFGAQRTSGNERESSKVSGIRSGIRSS